jgi:hypothetical protein
MRSSPRIVPAHRWAPILVCVGACCAIAIGTVPVLRTSVLRAAGHALVAEDAPAKADVIVISVDALSAGILEADDLVKAGYVTRVAIFARSQTPMQREFIRRGVQPLDLTAVSLRLLRSLGVTHIELIPAVVGTVDEGKVLQHWCTANSIHSLMFISTPDHSRRTRRVLNRALDPQGVRVMVRYARFAEFNPDNWWLSRSGQRTEITESEKLLLDLLRYPFG